MTDCKSKGLARHALWCHLIQSWPAYCKPAESTQACSRQAKTAVDGATMPVWPVPQGIFGLVDNKLTNCIARSPSPKFGHVIHGWLGKGKLGTTSILQGSPKEKTPGFENFVPSLA